MTHGTRKGNRYREVLMSRESPKDYSFSLKFGGGVHSRAPENEIDIRECASGYNFLLDLQNTDFRNREPFDLIGQVPNGQEIRGGATLLNSDGTISTLVQAGSTVYEWDGASTFTSVGSCSSTSQLRGKLEHNSQVDGLVIITDLNLQSAVMTWDGTTLTTVSFTGPAGTFKAKYCFVENERAWFANINDNAVAYPHLIVGSTRADYTTLSVSNRPSSSLSASDPFFMVQPDNMAINGMVEAFGNVVISSAKGSLYNITGYDAQTFSINPFFPRSGASGGESLTFVGNDIIYGRQGRIESVTSTNTYADVANDDLSVDIFDSIETFDNWTIVYNSRLQRIYCYPYSEAQIWTLFKPLLGGNLSPWVKYTTDHSMSFNPTFMMNMLDPSDGLEYVFMGDSSGNFYRMEGSGTSGDGGLNNIVSERVSKLIECPLDVEAYDVEGYIQYRKNESATVTLTFEYAGFNIFNESITISIPAITDRTTYGGGFYYADGNYYGSTFLGRLTRQNFKVAGKSNSFQVKIHVEGTTNFQIHDIILKFRGAK